jgi:hypothetical protein
MSSAATVLVCVLNLLGRTEASFPPIRLVEAPPPEAHPKADAYIGEGGSINLITSSATFQDAAEYPDHCRTPAMKKLASILIHEERHVKGEDEDAAYHAQLTTLLLLGVQPDSSIYIGVQKSMLAVVKSRKNRPIDGALDGTAVRNAAPPAAGQASPGGR